MCADFAGIKDLQEGGSGVPIDAPFSNLGGGVFRLEEKRRGRLPKPGDCIENRVPDS